MPNVVHFKLQGLRFKCFFEHCRTSMDPLKPTLQLDEPREHLREPWNQFRLVGHVEEKFGRWGANEKWPICCQSMMTVRTAVCSLPFGTLLCMVFESDPNSDGSLFRM
ncbi:hypothetical protein E1B28_003058 [Marasmius oreades]|uniref:Uncharacterized protein n=1 Tax=Marasmius oreades TaxID=181124 RepID=A0A9P7RLR8_9AGAR|nr:uncharacterized protein E1B28_003058 [Marasmius oreades]KAG7085495.1 hypothetical protein E1B28_003058 [Marasmius oreades]